jgi:hippurate hydrolase
LVVLSTTKFIADVAADLVGEAHVDRNKSLITLWGRKILPICSRLVPVLLSILALGIPRPFHSPRYDFNDAALPIGASLFARLVEKKLPRLFVTWLS